MSTYENIWQNLMCMHPFTFIYLVATFIIRDLDVSCNSILAYTIGQIHSTVSARGYMTTNVY